MQRISAADSGFFFRLVTRAMKVLTLPVFLYTHLLNGEIGRNSGAGFMKRFGLFFRIVRNTKKITSGTSWHEQVVLAGAILRIPKSEEGAVAECGCFKGASTASLSLACEMVGRKLLVFDSFEGLPEPEEADKTHVLPDWGEVHTYEKGAFTGALDEVKGNVSRYGAISVCEFIQGYYSDSMGPFAERFDGKIVFAFCDVDLRSSLEDCVIGLWPFVSRGCSFSVHEAHHIEIPALFFDPPWWKEHIGEAPPGLIGAGCGLSYGIGYSTGLGYATKAVDATDARLRTVPQDIEDSARVHRENEVPSGATPSPEGPAG